MAKLCSEHTRMLRSEAAKKRWSDPAFKARVFAKIMEPKNRNGCSEIKKIQKFAEVV